MSTFTAHTFYLSQSTILALCSNVAVDNSATLVNAITGAIYQIPPPADPGDGWIALTPVSDPAKQPAHYEVNGLSYRAIFWLSSDGVHTDVVLAKPDFPSGPPQPVLITTF